MSYNDVYNQWQADPEGFWATAATRLRFFLSRGAVLAALFAQRFGKITARQAWIAGTCRLCNRHAVLANAGFATRRQGLSPCERRNSAQRTIDLLALCIDRSMHDGSSCRCHACFAFGSGAITSTTTSFFICSRRHRRRRRRCRCYWRLSGFIACSTRAVLTLDTRFTAARHCQTTRHRRGTTGR